MDIVVNYRHHHQTSTLLSTGPPRHIRRTLRSPLHHKQWPLTGQEACCEYK